MRAVYRSNRSWTSCLSVHVGVNYDSRVSDACRRSTRECYLIATPSAHREESLTACKGGDLNPAAQRVHKLGPFFLSAGRIRSAERAPCGRLCYAEHCSDVLKVSDEGMIHSFRIAEVT
jgi:hypothetical protein